MSEISHFSFCENRLSMCPKKRIRYHQEDVGVVGKEYEMIAYDNGVYFLEGQMDMGMGMDMDMSELGGGVQEEPPMGINSPRTSAGSGTMSTDSSEDPVGGNSDDEESNLSWLLNFKVDSLFCLDNHEQQKRQFEFDEQIKMEGAHRFRTQETTNYLQSIVHQTQNRGFLAEANGASNNHGISHNPTKRSKHDQSVKDLINFGALLSPNKKPPFTYTELIEQALTEKGELTVSGIYKWISDHFSYYKSDDDRWKNSVRHNLSINPLFCKGVKAPKGAGHLWTIVNRDDTSFTLRKQQRTKLLCSYISLGEVAAATASIEENKENRTLDTLQEIENMDTLETFETDDPLAVCDEPSLEQSAEDILTGIKREVQVQYVQSGQRPNDTDFLNPVAKEVIVEESGLIERLPGELDGSYVIADLDTDGLEFSISETEIITADNLLFDEMNCQLYELSSPVYHLEV